MLRRQNIPYLVIWILYYAWVIVFSTWWTATPDALSPFDAQTRALIHEVNLLSSAGFVLIVRREWFVRMARIGSVLVIVTLLAFIVIRQPTARLAAAVLCAVSIGCVNIAILMPFTFRLNDDERLCAVGGSNVLIYLLLLLQNVAGLNAETTTAASCVLLLAALAAVLFFRKSDAAALRPSADAAKPHVGKGGYLMLALSCVFAFLGKGVAKGLLDTAATVGTASVPGLFLAASALGALLFCVLVKHAAALPNIWNITFGFLAAAFVFYAFSERTPTLLIGFACFAGLGNTMGMCNMYYLVGVIGNRSDSLRYVRLSILLIGVCGGISGVIMGNIIASQSFPGLTVAVGVIAALLVLAFLAASPALPRYGEGRPHARATKVDTEEKPVSPFEGYGLSKRETEVCELLLQGYTMKQIAGLLSIAYPTVNTYCTSLYRKTGVNSRTELMLLFREHLQG